MSDVEKDSGRDALDAQVAAKLRALRLGARLPEPGPDEPSDEELLRYIDGAVSGAERERLEERIAKSPYATARVGVVVEALRDCGYPAPKVDPVGRRVARYVFRRAADAFTFLRGSESPAALAPALAVRGAQPIHDAGFYEFTHHFDQVAATLQVEGVSASGFALQLTLTDGGKPVEGARVTLRSGGKTVESAQTEDGTCAFAGLTASQYQLDVKRGADAIGTLHVDVLS